MFGDNTRRYLSASWLLLALLTFFVADLTSPGAVLLLTIVATVPPLMLLVLWNDGPSLSVAISAVTHPRSR